MKLRVSQSPVQSDTGQQLHPSRGQVLHHDGRVKEGAFSVGWGAVALAPSRSGTGRGGGRVVAVAVAVEGREGRRGGAGGDFLEQFFGCGRPCDLQQFLFDDARPIQFIDRVFLVVRQRRAPAADRRDVLGAGS